MSCGSEKLIQGFKLESWSATLGICLHDSTLIKFLELEKITKILDWSEVEILLHSIV